MLRWDAELAGRLDRTVIVSDLLLSEVSLATGLRDLFERDGTHERARYSAWCDGPSARG